MGKKNNYGIMLESQICRIVSKYFEKAEIDVSERKHVSHTLRHSLASNMA